MFRVQFIFAATLTVLVIATAHAADKTQLQKQLESLDPAHPRLFGISDAIPRIKKDIATDPRLDHVWQYIEGSAAAMRDLEPVKREKTGKRLLGVSRTALRRISYLAFAYRMTEEKRHLERAQKEMLAAAEFTDWNPSHFLDVAEMTAALAIGYDWLYDDLDPEAREKIKTAIVEKGLETSQEGGWWVLTTNNWNQVCHGGLTMGALAVAEDHPELAAEIIARAIKNVPRAMNEYEPHGVYPEGPSYWAYGTTYNVLLIDVLKTVLGDDFGLADTRGFMRSPEFYLHATGPTGLFYNFSDCGTRGRASAAMQWFAQRRNKASLLWYEQDKLADFADTEPKGSGGSNRLLPFLLIWGQPTAEIAPPAQLHWHGDGRTPVALFRSAWNENATYLGIKGGSPETNHAHMDIGSFVLDMQGERWAVDLGAQGYHSLESKGIDLWNKSQNSERWTVFRLNNYSHSTLTVDGELQRVKGDAPITTFNPRSKEPYTLIDLGSVYKDQLAAAQRGAKLLGESVLIQDEIKTTDKENTTIRWALTTRAEIELGKEKRTATLAQDKQSITVHLLSPKTATFQTNDIEDPPHDYDATNPNTRQLRVEITLPAETAETLAVYAQPNNKTHPPPPIAPLTEW